MDDPGNPELLALIADAELHAPSLLDYEVASALRGHTAAGKLSERRSSDAVDDFTALQTDRYPLSGMISAVLTLRENFTVHDAAYIVLAQVLEVPLVTADLKLAEAGRLGIHVRILRPHR